MSKWGKRDQIGALNEITSKVVLDSVLLVKSGKVHSLAQTYELNMPTIWFHGPFFYSTLRKVETCLNMFEENRNRLGSVVCRYELSDHTGTHVDSLNHASVEFDLYNGLDFRDIETDNGTTKLGIETMPPVITRGLLIDMPALLGVDILEEGHEITSGEIETFLAKEQIELQPADAVLFYTGYSKLWAKDNARYLGNSPGIGLRGAKWLARRRVSILGADTASFEVVKSDMKLLFPCHQVLIKENGLHLVENLKLDELAREQAYEFLFICTPLKFKGGAGSPVAPVAVY
jgi:kynurenine formamidase